MRFGRIVSKMNLTIYHGQKKDTRLESIDENLENKVTPF